MSAPEQKPVSTADSLSRETPKVIKVWEYGKGWRIEQVNQESQVQVRTPGVYELPSGEIFVVKFNHEKTRLYAKKLVETSERLTVSGSRVDFDFVYERGAIYRIRPEHKMAFERAKELMIKYGRCIVCGHGLKVADSVERGIGPVCIKTFAN